MDTKKEPEYLYDRLRAYAASAAYPFHMPGHKRRLGSMDDPFTFDITEIDGFDNLHHAGGILREAQERAAVLYHAKKTYFLVNGSSCGLLAAVSAARVTGERQTAGKPLIAAARNCHRAVYHALYLNDLQPLYVYPSGDGSLPAGINGPVDPREVEAILSQNPKTCAVIITSPTYDGVVSDVKGIAAAAHAHGAVLIVDEAHGAHFGFHPDLPPSSVTEGADIVIHSVHKTLPSLTQTALLHICSDRVEPALVERFLRIYQTSSPSYVLMASIDQCIRRMQSRIRPDLDALLAMLERFYAGAAGLKYLSAVRTDDPTRILITCGDGRLSGHAICDMLREHFEIECEMAAPGYALCLTSIGDDEEGFVRLLDALLSIDRELDLKEIFPERTGLIDAYMRPCGQETHSASRSTSRPEVFRQITRERPEAVLPLRSAWDAAAAAVPLEKSAGRISADFVYLYPPGIPLLVPGERIREELTAYLLCCREEGYELQGMRDMSGLSVQVIP